VTGSLLVLGGARSGKTAHAQSWAERTPGRLAYVATAQAFDAEMTERIALHRSERGTRWHTIEAPLALPDALAQAARNHDAVMVDCLTLWLSNLMLGGHAVAAATDRLADAVAACTRPLVIVANEVGLGIVPDNALARRFRDEAGRLNQRIAQVADHVTLMTAGLAIRVK
jgi:adenosylcobinamide kinase/adenosylcobinamide-phosphate guanylyltransferase